MIRYVFAFLLFSYTVAAGQNGEWDTYLARYEKGPGSTLVNMALKKTAPDSSRPFLFAAGVKFKNCTQEGLPAATAFISLNRISDSIVALMGRHPGQILAGTFSYQCERKDYFYVNDTTDMKRFLVKYSDATIWGGALEMSYFDSDRFRVTGSVNAFKFSEVADLDQPWHRPTLEWTLSGMYRFNKRMSMTADVFGVNKTLALLPGDITEEVKGCVDMNISATYVYSKYFNIFVNLNNLANYKYQRYYNYPSYGIQAMAGLSFAF